MNSRQSILQRLTHADGDVAARARQWLSDEQTCLITDETPNLTVHQASHIWRIRQKIGAQHGTPIFGAEPLLAALSTMAPQRRLEQFSFNGTDWVGNLFFERSSGRFVGAVMVEPKAKRMPGILAHESSQLATAGPR